MRPRPLSKLQARDSRLQPLRPGAAAAIALVWLTPAAALAQEAEAGSAPASGQIETGEDGDQASPVAGRKIAFEANEIRYESDSETVTVAGNVLLRSGDQSVRADSVTWNRTTGQIVASGNIRYVDEDGNQILTDRLELTDELKAGAMQNMLLAFRTGGKMAISSSIARSIPPARWSMAKAAPRSRAGG